MRLLATAVTVVMLSAPWWSGAHAQQPAEKSVEVPDPAVVCANPTSMPLRRTCRILLERGEPPMDAARNALSQIDALRALGVSSTTERWISIGPAPVIGGDPAITWTGRPRTGRVAAIAVDPTNSARWLIGAAGGGIWETTNSGASWQPRTDSAPSLAMGAIAFAPSNPSIVYAGTGEAVFSVDAYGGYGVLKSIDGGRSWTHIAGTEDSLGNRGISDLVVDPANPDVIVAAVTSARMWRAVLVPPGPMMGIVKSTNGGVTWTPKKAGEGTDLEIDPRSFSNQYAGLGGKWGPTGGMETGVYRSTDAGEVWRRIDGPWMATASAVGRVELAISPSHPDVMYVSIHNAGTTNQHGLLGLWKTTNAWAPCPLPSGAPADSPCPAGQGPSWQPISVAQTDNGTGFGYCGFNPGTPPRPVPQCFYNHELSVDPTNPDVLYAGGVSLWKYDGAQWHQIGFLPNDGGIHADQHRMRWAGNRLIVGNDGGVWSTTSGGSAWQQHNIGLATVQFWGGALSPATAFGPSLVFLGGTQDNGTAVWTGTTWQGLVRGDAAAPVISPTKPTTHWGIAAIGRGLEIWRTRNGGATMKTVALPDEMRKGAVIAAPFVHCPHNHDIVLYGNRALWKTSGFFSRPRNNLGWTKNSPDLTDDSRTLTAIAFAPSDVTCQTYAVAAMDRVGGVPRAWVRMTTNGGGSWKDLDPTGASGPLPQGRVPRGLAFDPTTERTLLVVYSGFAANTFGKRLFRTADTLATTPTWTNVSPTPGTLDLPLNSVVIDPSDPRIVWVGTDRGVLRGQWNTSTNDFGWQHYPPNTGLPNVIVSDVKLHAATKIPVAFTHGRGAFALVNMAALCAGGWVPTVGSNFGVCPP